MGRGKALVMASQKKGSIHWRHQRLTAIALVPLVIAFVVLMPMLAASTHAEVRELVAHPLAIIVLVLGIILGAWHMQLGLDAVIDDYIPQRKLKLVIQRCVLLGALLIMAIGIGSVAILAF